MSDENRNLLDDLAEEFVSRYRRGERPALTEYADRYPELAGEIRDLFPALVLVEQVRPGYGEMTPSLGTGLRAAARLRFPLAVSGRPPLGSG